MKRVLIFIAKQGFNLSDLYNPEGVAIYRKDPSSDFAKQVGGKEGELVLVEYVEGNTWKVIRRVKYPWSDNQYNFLLHGNGSGTGNNPKEDRPFIVGKDDELSLGLRTGGPDFGIGIPPPDLGKDFWLILIIGFLAYQMSKE